ncbi:MAG: hypothetical protein P1P88_13395 [Bacteroidales bacterium]|nr:hypothetical protein [Bacteroidales bacterium]
MKIHKLFFIIFVITLITSCTKDDLIDQIKETQIKEHHELFTQNGMLVFDSEESFDASLNKVQNMDYMERKKWEEELGFESFNRAVGEVIDEQISYQAKFASLDPEELLKRLLTGEIEEFSPSMKKYIEKGIISIVIDENNEQNFDVNYPLYPSLVNIDGFVVVGKEILQYKKNKFKLIKSLDFNKINQLETLNDNINDKTFFVTDIIKQTREKVTLYSPIFKYSAESFTNDRQKVVATETYIYYDRYYDGINYEATYTLEVTNYKKYWGFLSWNWNTEFARTWVWGNFEIERRVPFLPKKVDFSYPDRNISSYTYTLSKETFSKYDYLNNSFGGPKILNSTLNVTRWGGDHGLGVRLINHERYERF